ncbi:MAG: Lrp/AsnC family transcriptional regulator, partial [Bacillota bacterium]
MTLTRRRKEFLSKIAKIYKKTGEPVHYATVAQSLAVSKWTAYDVLRELEKEGLLTMEYAINREDRLPGRSQVLFRPTPLAMRLLEIEEVENLPGEDWLLVKKRLLSVFDNIKNLGAKKIIDELLEEMQTIE